MQQFNITAYEVTCPDGGGMHDQHVAYFSTKYVAEEYAKARTKASKWPHSVYPFQKSYTVLDTPEELEASREIRAREAALAKLTDAEKKILGIG